MMSKRQGCGRSADDCVLQAVCRVEFCGTSLGLWAKEGGGLDEAVDLVGKET